MPILFPLPQGHQGGTASRPQDTHPVEAAMVAEGARIRVGPHPGDVLAVEDLAIGDAIWDIAKDRLVDLETLACATLGARELADLGLRTVSTTAKGTIAIASTRLRERTPNRAALQDEPPSGTQDDTPRVFYCLWPETRVHALIDQTIYLINPPKWT